MTIKSLSKKWYNEQPHADHVALLALTIFDALRGFLKLSEGERRYLEIAALLHDIGYIIAPQHHGMESARIITSTKIEGLSTADRTTIAAIAALHQNLDDGKKFCDQKAPSRHHRTVWLKLGALLRIADGLDHSHTQDCTITAISCNEKCVTITIRSRWYHRTAEWCQKKGDLWQELWGTTPIRIIETGTIDPHERPFTGIVLHNQTLYDGCRLIFASQIRCLLDLHSEIQHEYTPRRLHDLRVAIRRIRVALAVFKKNLPLEIRMSLDTQLKSFCKSFGKYRDADVWLELCKKMEKNQPPEERRWLQAYRASLAKKKVKNQVTINKILGSTQTTRTLRDLSVFARTGIKPLFRDNKKKAYIHVGQKKIGTFFKRYKKMLPLAHKDSIKALHDLRRYFRKERYCAEFFAPLFDDSMNFFVDTMQTISHNLGIVHDLDIALQVSKTDGFPTIIVSNLQSERTKRLTQAHKALELLQGKKFRKKVMTALGEYYDAQC